MKNVCFISVISVLSITTVGCPACNNRELCTMLSFIIPKLFCLSKSKTEMGWNRTMGGMAWIFNKYLLPHNIVAEDVLRIISTWIKLDLNSFIIKEIALFSKFILDYKKLHINFKMPHIFLSGLRHLHPNWAIKANKSIIIFEFTLRRK